MWGLYHALAAGGWSPVEVRDWTLAQALVVSLEKPPGTPERITTYQQHLDALAERERAENSW